METWWWHGVGVGAVSCLVLVKVCQPDFSQASPQLRFRIAPLAVYTLMSPEKAARDGGLCATTFAVPPPPLQRTLIYVRVFAFGIPLQLGPIAP